MNERGECSRCSDSNLIGIDPRTFERKPSIKWDLIPAYHELATSIKGFWESADSVDAVRLHVTLDQEAEGPNSSGAIIRRPARPTHYSVYLDVGKLLESISFREGCLSVLRKIPKPDLSLIPSHVCSSKISHLVQEAFGSTPVEYINPGRMDSTAVKAVSSATSILIADDALVSGSTLRGLRSELYRITQAAGINPRIDAFVAVARPPSKEILQSVRRPFFSSDGNHLHCGSTVFLPNSADCPWCEELKLLRAFRNSLSPRSKARADLRIRRLESEICTPFILGTEELSDSLSTVGSFIGDLRSHAAFAAMSSVAQNIMGNIEKEALGAKMQVANVPMLITSYFEAVLLAGLLRTFKVRHMRWAGQDKEIGDVLKTIDLKRIYPGVLPELVWAAAKAKIPARPVLELVNSIGPVGEDLAMLCELVSLNATID